MKKKKAAELGVAVLLLQTALSGLLLEIKHRVIIRSNKRRRKRRIQEEEYCCSFSAAALM